MVLTGFNTDFKFKGQVYHAQTEDNGEDNPVIVTLLYLKGAILASKKTSYDDILGQEGFQAELMERMKTQHRDMMKSVLTGEFDGHGEKETVEPVKPEAAPPPAAEETPAAVAATPARGPEAPPSKEPKNLDEAILDFLAAFESSQSPGA